MSSRQPSPIPQRKAKSAALTPEQTAQLDQLLRQQSITGLSDDAISVMVGCSRMTVIRRRNKIAADVAAPGITPRQALEQEIRESTKPAEGPTAGQLLEMYPDIATLEPAQTMRLLSILAVTSVNTTAQVAALTTLEKLRAQLTAPEDQKLPAPYSVDERVDMLSQLMDCCGLAITQRALQKVWPDVSQG